MGEKVASNPMGIRRFSILDLEARQRGRKEQRGESKVRVKARVGVQASRRFYDYIWRNLGRGVMHVPRARVPP